MNIGKKKVKVVDGRMRGGLPPGFRFEPTDEEVVFQYLLRKTFSCPLPPSIIPEYHHHHLLSILNPNCHSVHAEQDIYFFTNKLEELKYKNGGDQLGGYWKSTGLDKLIISSSKRKKSFVGKRKTLVFYQGKPPHATTTNWIMHQYRLILSSARHHNSTIQIGNWVICHIFMKKRSNKLSSETFDMASKYCSRFEGESTTTTSSSSSVASDSSVITHEVSSHCNDYSSY